MSPGHDVFISHSSRNKTVADAVCSALESRNIRCWIAPRNVRAGIPYAEALIEALDDSRIMVVLLSAGSNISPQVLREVERAASRGNYIVPVRIEDITLSPSLQYFIGSIHWIDAVTPPLEQHLDRLVETVTSLLARIAKEGPRPAEEGMTVPSAGRPSVGASPAATAGVGLSPTPAASVDVGLSSSLIPASSPVLQAGPLPAPDVARVASVGVAPTKTMAPYIDFDVFFQGSKETGYQARVKSSGGQATVTFRLPFSDLELENLLLTVGRTRRLTRRIDSPDVDKIKRFGGNLFSAVFTGESLACLLNSIREGRQSGHRGVRIRLNLTDAPDLADLPWEYLYYSPRNLFLARSVDTPIVRYLNLSDAPEPLRVVPPLRALVIIASPQDYPALDAEREWTYLRTALVNLETAGLVSLERLAEANLPALQQKLRRGSFHIVHFIGHGGFDSRTQDGVLILEGEDHRGQEVMSEKLGVLFRDHHSLRLAILNACEGARASKTDPFAGVAQSLIQQGLAAVVAMQFEITDEAANLFTREFYMALADGYPVDAALAETRKAIYLSGNDQEWGTPVLYMRAPDGRIFDIEARKETMPAVLPIETPAPPASQRVAVFCRKCGASMPGRKFCTKCGAKLQ